MNQAVKRRLLVLGLVVWGFGSFMGLLRDGAVGFLGALVLLPVLLSLLVWLVLLLRWAAAALGWWKPRTQRMTSKETAVQMAKHSTFANR